MKLAVVVSIHANSAACLYKGRANYVDALQLSWNSDFSEVAFVFTRKYC